MKWCGTALVLAACQFDATYGGGNPGVGGSGSTEATTSTASATTKAADDTAGASSEVDASGTDATADPSSTDGGSSSTGPDPPAFEVGPFGAAIELAMLNSFAHDDDPTLRGDMLEIYFATGRRGSEEIFRSVRATVDDDWALPDIVAAFDTIDWETTPELSRDGRTMMLALQSPTSEVDLYMSTRANVDTVDWTAPQPIGELNTGIGDLGLVLTEDLFTGYFCRRDNPSTDLYRATRTQENGPFEEIAIAMPFGTDAYECNPWIEPAGTTIVFGGGPSQDTRDLQWATLNGDAFDPPQTAALISTADPEDDPWLSDDGGVIFFSRTVAAQQDLYWARRP